MQRSLGGIFFGETIGTFLLVLLVGVCTDMSTRFEWPFWVMVLSWVVSIAIAIRISSFWSDAHLNPSVTVAQMITGMPLDQTIPNLAGQLTGAVFAGVVLWFLSAAEPEPFFPYSRSARFREFYLLVGMEGIASFLLVFVVYASTWKLSIRTFLPGFLIAAGIGIICFCFVGWVPINMNPIKDLGPRMVYNWDFNLNDSIIYLIVPVVSGALFGLSHQIFIKMVRQ